MLVGKISTRAYDIVIVPAIADARYATPHIVMAGPAEGRVPAIHVLRRRKKTWMAVTSTAMTKTRAMRVTHLRWPVPVLS